MEYLEWSDKYNLNNERLDNDHKQLLKITNRLTQRAGASNNSEILTESLYQLLRFIESHFKTEEEIMLKNNCKEYEKHKQLHNEFHKNIAKFCHQAMKQQTPITHDLLTLLQHWITRHIVEENAIFREVKPSNT